MSADSRTLYLNLNGIPSTTAPTNEDVFFIFTAQGAWQRYRGDLSFDIDAKCVEIHYALAKVIFKDLELYRSLLRSLPEFVATAGLNSESPMSRAEFEQALVEMADVPYLNHFLYLFDCQQLVSSIQECMKEAVYLQGEFYRALNLDELFYPGIQEPDGVRWIMSPVVTRITAIMHFIFIRLHSSLDYMTKLIYEIEHLKGNFNLYPRLASANIKFGDRKKIRLNGAPDTLFEPCKLVGEIEFVRNLVIHDGFLDDVPKVYKVVQSGVTIEKFLLMPDCINGRLEKFKNRRLFYSGVDKINLRLPELLSSFQTRQMVTLQLALDKLNKTR